MKARGGKVKHKCTEKHKRIILMASYRLFYSTSHTSILYEPKTSHITSTPGQPILGSKDYKLIHRDMVSSTPPKDPKDNASQ